MRSVASIRKLLPQEWRTYRELRLRALKDSPEAFGSTLAAEEQRPESEWHGRLLAGQDSHRNLPLIAEVRAEPAGLAWGRVERPEPDVVHVYQMWVAPDCRRLGAGRMLLGAIIDWARTLDAREVVLGVAGGDSPATRLYAGAGFVRCGESSPMRPGSAQLGYTMRLELAARGLTRRCS